MKDIGNEINIKLSFSTNFQALKQTFNAFRYKHEISKKWLTSKKEICGWLEQKEKERLDGENIQRSNTKFVLEKKKEL